MAGERYRIVLRVISNFAGPAEKGKLGEYSREYLERMLGIGTVEVLSVEAELDEAHPADDERPTMPVPSRPPASVSVIVTAEPGTGTRRRIE